ncbi:methylated-DNA--[protein]-cysteine S-methyltransferase [Hoyosella altamirensis]|uniref:Methylated-DNA-[protein]-cysteine S-methyltransferase n=1 Tax=Hoyosella altamirensis TaxID=616997 RepID=A0A839RIL0_9ACTN|nr:methylated-DNA--[protein]-cysteine S-methyltransferase [Hoyosella altamirensis]MBB3036652.1 methylated-DNA-[protein]-cysteine S-methyltransferase [Hoyosella altamirensis]
MTGVISGRSATLSTPNGPFTVVVSEIDSVLASGWTGYPSALTGLIHPQLRPSSVEEVPASAVQPIADAVTAYYDGELDSVSAVPVEQQSGDFLIETWKMLRDVAPGAPVTYGDLARRSGNPRAARAAASACARNAAALFVPCHRVVRTGGALGGFRWGLDTKTWLLTHEEMESR